MTGCRSVFLLFLGAEELTPAIWKNPIICFSAIFFNCSSNKRVREHTFSFPFLKGGPGGALSELAPGVPSQFRCFPRGRSAILEACVWKAPARCPQPLLACVTPSGALDSIHLAGFSLRGACLLTDSGRPFVDQCHCRPSLHVFCAPSTVFLNSFPISDRAQASSS